MKAVAAQQDDVADLEVALGQMDVDLLARAEHVGQHVPHRVVSKIGRLDARIVREDGRGPGIVLGQLLDRATAQQVEAAVADVADRHPRSVGEEAHDGGAHAAVIVVALSGAEDAAVRQMDRRAQPVAVVREIAVKAVGPGEVGIRRRSPDEAADGFDGKPRCDFTGLVTTHPIRNGE